MSALEEKLAAGLAALSLTISEQKKGDLIGYLQLLQKWNQTYNLTAISQLNQMCDRHLMDSLVIKPFLKGDAILDLGSGAGLPGIPLAIVDPTRQFTLLDSREKRVNFLQQVVWQLQLHNVDCIHSRIETHDANARYHCIVVRAFGPLKTIFDKAHHHLHDKGVILAMKGHYPAQELTTLPANLAVHVERIYVPGLSVHRHLVIMEQNKTC